MNRFVDLFKQYDWTVEQLGDNSFIAYNDIFFVPFSCIPFMNTKDEFISAVSYLVCDKDEFIKDWEKNKDTSCRSIIDIGTYAFQSTFGKLKFYRFGGLCNHDHDFFEVKHWLEMHDKNRKRKG